MYKRLGLFVGFLTLVSVACAQQANLPAKASSISSVAAPLAASSASLGGVLKKDMAYADARKVLLARGWTPAKDPQCKTNIGADKASQKLCSDIPELIAYSEEGDAVMHFVRGGQRLAVWGEGDIGDWGVSGADSNLTVSDWEITNNAR